MKKILLIYFFAFCGCLGFCPDSQAKILEKNVWAGMYCNWSLSDDGVMVIKGTGKMELQEDMLDIYKDKIKKYVFLKELQILVNWVFQIVKI